MCKAEEVKEMTQFAYELKNVVKKFRPKLPPANKDISLSIRRGEIFGLLGPNGAGKTTLVRQLAGLSRPTSGEIKLFNHDLVKNPEIAAHYIALQPQGTALPSREKVSRLIELTGQIRGLSPQDAKEETARLMEDFNLYTKRDATINNLSGGQRRLVSIAATLIGKRQILIFDEPTNDLDPEVRRVVWSRIKQAAQQGTTVVLVTHNVMEAEQVLDRVAILRSGSILAIGTPSELKKQVSQLIRLELMFRSNAVKEALHIFEGWENVYRSSDQHYIVTVSRDQVKKVVEKVLTHLDLLDDFRIVTSNLEDIYIKFSKGERIEEGATN